MSTPPKWYKPVAIVALIWNLLGCMAYLMDVMISPEDIAMMTPAEQAMYAERTTWAVSATAIAVWCGAAGSLGLVMRKRWTLPLLVVSLAGVLLQDLWLFVMSNASEAAGSTVAIFQGLVLIIAIALVMLARTAIQRDWIPKQSS